MDNYSAYGIDIEVTEHKKGTEIIVRHKAAINLEMLTNLSDVAEFITDIKKLEKVIKRTVSRGNIIEISFFRYSYEDGCLTKEREARYIGNGNDIAENEGFMLTERSGKFCDGSGDFWVILGANLFDAIREFGDNAYYLTETKRRV